MITVKQIISAGDAIRLASAKIAKLHPAMLLALSTSDIPKECKKQTAKAWFTKFVAFIQGSYDWPVDDKGKPVGYRTIMRKPTQYSKQVVNACHYFNRFQSYLNSHKLIQASKTAPNRASKANVITADDILKRARDLMAIAEKVETVDNGKANRHLVNFCKLFGVKNPELSQNITRK